jgi:XTP/dITP diphosphohydrolase
LTDRLRIVLATQNRDKVREITQILNGLPVDLLSLRDFPDVQPAEEDGATFEENAIKKAMHVWQKTGLATLADDSGLVVDALGGEPGVMSATFAGEGASYEANNTKLLQLLAGVPAQKRGAKFVCVAVFMSPEGKIVLQRGELKGEIIDERRGSGGFGYDPIFYVPRLKQTVAELDADTKNTISHRAKAVAAMRDYIMSLMTPPAE